MLVGKCPQGSYGDIIKKIEKEIANLDEWQKKAAFEVPDGPQRIKGLAGSGKTIVLALKAAYLHTQYPELKIGVTYYTRALYQQYVNLITDFVQDMSGEKVDWDNLDIIHAWGSNSEHGVYSDMAQKANFKAYNLTSAISKFGRTSAFKGCCDELLTVIGEDYEPEYDVMLIDEAQDLPSSFFRLVYANVKSPKRIIWAYDELQNLSTVEMPSLEEMFGVDDGVVKKRVIRMKKGRKNCDEQLIEQISNTLEMLLEKGLLYTYNELKREYLDKNTIRLSWNNHLSGSFNSGDNFLKLEQYKQIINNQSYLCVLFDGSLIRVSYTIKNGCIVGHNLLWWPAPYKYSGVSLDDVPPKQMLSDFLEDDKWYENIEMRSPVRIDYDPRKEVVSSAHPPVHMHIEHMECRIFIEKPMCFNSFIKLIFNNFYPDCKIYLDPNDYISFEVDDNYEYVEGLTKIVC